MRTRLVALLSLLLLGFAASADAQPPASGAAHVQRVNGTLRGTVTNAAGQGLAGVTVKIFEEGFLLEEASCAADGTYDLRFQYLPDIDWTIVAWYVPEDPQLVPEILILRESLRSKGLDLWSTCLPRIELTSRMHYDATLVDGNTKRQQIAELDCFRRQDQ